MGEEPAECDEDTPLDDVLAKIQWTDAGVVSSDPRLKDHDPASFEPDLRMPKKEENNLLDWWLHWFPKSLVLKIVAAINNNAASIKFPANGRWKLLSAGEFLRWMGLWLLMSVYKANPRREYWRGRPGFGKYMAEKRFDAIMTAFALPKYQKNHDGWGGHMGKKMKHDKMAGCRKFLDLLQDRWSEAITPGGWLVIDESMVAWLGVLIKMPGWKVIKRKPHPFGLEFKTVCCCVTGIMINFEAQEGKDIMKHARHIKLLNKSTAWVMRLMEPWFGSERTVVADAAFGQVRAVVALRGKGLYMLCNIKQCHKYFPKAKLKEDTPAFQSNSKCTCLTLKATLRIPGGKEVTLLACGWRATTNMVVTYLGSCGLTIDGTARNKERYQLLKSGKTKTINYQVQGLQAQDGQ